MTSTAVLFGMTWAELVPILAGLVMFAVVMFVWINVVEKDDVSKRAKAVRAHKRQVLSSLPQAEKRPRISLQRENRLTSFVSVLRKRRAEQTANIRNVLAVAGFRSNEAIGIYVLTKFLGPVVIVLLAFMVYYSSPALQSLSPLLKFTMLGLAGFMGIALPDSLINFMGRSRQAKIQAALPDALDLMVICTEAGLALEPTFERVSQEMLSTNKEVSEELNLTAVELSIMPERSEALNNLLRRTDVPAIESVVSTLNQTERYGTPLAQSFRILSADFRDARLLKAEEKAAKLPATLTVPMIGFIFPCLFAVLLGPAVIQTMNTL
jgi:tight adherence protein C